MKNLLADRLRKYEKDTFSRLVAFMGSPYLQKSEKALQYILLIKPYHPEMILPASARQKLKRLFPSESAHHVLVSRLNDILDDFELYEEFGKRDHLKRALRYEIELDKKNNVRFYQQLEPAATTNGLSSDDLYAEFYKEFHSIALCENNWIQDKEKIFRHSELAMRHIFQFALSKYLMVYANQATHQVNLAKTETEPEETVLLLAYLERHIDRQPTPVRFLYYVIQLYRNISGNNAVFDQYADKLKLEAYRLDPGQITYEEKYALIQASSACIFKCHIYPEYLKRAFELIRFLVEKDLYFSILHQSMIQQRFILVLKVALGANESGWAANFIREQLQRIDPVHREDFLNYANGLIHFHQRDYNAAIRAMIRINLNLPNFIADYKMTLLKMYYELHDLPGFNYQAQTFMKFLGKEKTLNKLHRKNMADSVECIKWMFRYKKNKKQAGELLDKLRGKQIDYLVLNYRDKWFADKYAELNTG